MIDGCSLALRSASLSVVLSGICHRNKVNSIEWLSRWPRLHYIALHLNVTNISLHHIASYHITITLRRFIADSRKDSLRQKSLRQVSSRHDSLIQKPKPSLLHDPLIDPMRFFISHVIWFKLLIGSGSIKLLSTREDATLPALVSDTFGEYNRTVLHRIPGLLVQPHQSWNRGVVPPGRRRITDAAVRRLVQTKAGKPRAGERRGRLGNCPLGTSDGRTVGWASWAKGGVLFHPSSLQRKVGAARLDGWICCKDLSKFDQRNDGGRPARCHASWLRICSTTSEVTDMRHSMPIL